MMLIVVLSAPVQAQVNPSVNMGAIDVRRYNVRAVGAVPMTTSTTTAGSASVALASPSAFQNGDGIVIRGAGRTLSVANPAAPNVTGSNAAFLTGTGLTVPNPDGHTEYVYKIVAVDLGGGYTVASPAGSLMNGAESLGAESVKVRSWTQQANTVTLITSSPHHLVGGAMVSVAGTGAVDGYYVLESTPSKTSFVYKLGTDTRNGAPTSGGAVGTATWYNCNHVAWTAVPNAWKYLIYGRTAGKMELVGTSLPQNNNAKSDPLYNTWDDFGQVAPSGPDWVPNSPPLVAKNDDLVTTIASGAGTTSLSLAARAFSSVSAAVTKFDNAPNIVRAAGSVTTGGAVGPGYLYFPPAPGLSYVTNSVMVLPGFPSVLIVVQSGTLALGDTVITGGATQWYGAMNNGGGGQFQYSAQPVITSGAASPIIYSQSVLNMSGISISGTMPNSQVLVLEDAGGQIPQGQFDRVQFQTQGAADLSSIHYLLRSGNSGSSGFFFRYCTFVGGSNTASATPLLYFSSSFGITAKFENIFFAKRGAFLRGGGQYTVDWDYTQGGVMPVFTVANTDPGNSGLSLEVHNSVEDTMSSPLVNVMGGGLQGLVRVINSNGPQPGFPMVVTPGPRISVEVSGVGGYTGTNPGATTGTSIISANGLQLDGILSSQVSVGAQDIKNLSLSVGNPYQVFARSLAQPPPDCSVSSGGSVPVGDWQFRIAPVFATGGEGTLSSPSAACAAKHGDQTITIKWAAVNGAVGYDLYANGFSFQCAAPWVRGGSITTYVWNGAPRCGTSAPSFSGSGPTALTAAGLVAPQLKLEAADGSGSTLLMAKSAGELGGFVLPFKIFVPAARCNGAEPSSSFSLSRANAPAPNCNEGTDVQEGTLDFLDGQSAEFAYALPSDWAGAVDARVIFYSNSLAGSVAWNIAAVCGVAGRNKNTVFDPPELFETVTLGRNEKAEHSSRATGIKTGGCKPGDSITFKIGRASDTAAGTAKLKGVELTLRRQL